ncbi:NAD(+) hydrolase sarm1-like [Sycon ciliatum]|uniref:NAD(+) hydrolase sarm1-like n=1 Tax=Sycon ciliatum TaxID=27933 RepID=UPI0031F678A9
MPVVQDAVASPASPPSVESDVPFEADRINAPLKQIFSESASEQKSACDSILALLNTAWSTPVVGRDLAYSLCDRIREAKGIERLVALCTCCNVSVRLASVGALEQCLTPANRHLLVRLELDQFISTVRCWKGDTKDEDFPLVKACLGVMESLFKQSSYTCNRLIDIGALDAILYTCRSPDERIQRHCAAALANCGMYGTAQTQRNMIQRDTAEWLFRLAFSGDASVQYYACLAISILASNPDIEELIRPSGTLDLIAPFVMSHDPGEFVRSDPAHCQGRSADWLRRLVPVVKGNSKPAQCLAAFHFAMEASIKKEQGNVQVFQEIGAIAPLQNVAMRGTRLSRQLAKSALLLMGHELPKHMSLELLTWKVDDIGAWLKDIGLETYAQRFAESVIDGELLSSLTDEDIKEELKITNRLHRRKLLREIVRLRSFADYDSQDTDGIGQWLCDVGKELARYRGAFLESGVTKSLLPYLTEEDLQVSIGIQNAIHRKKVLLAILQQTITAAGAAGPASRGRVNESTTTAAAAAAAATAHAPQTLMDSLQSEQMLSLGMGETMMDTMAAASFGDEQPTSIGIEEIPITRSYPESSPPGGPPHKLLYPAAVPSPLPGPAPGTTSPATSSEPLDVFISYRRATGSQLASLLKVHLRLKLRHLNVFLDVDELGAGKFDEALLDHIATARNFLLVLSPQSLDRCIGDHYMQDWVHKEVNKAVVSQRNIIPVIDESFEWPDVNKLPEGIRCVTKFNGVAWSHIYQDAAIDKIIQFLKLDCARAVLPPSPIASPEIRNDIIITDNTHPLHRTVSMVERPRALAVQRLASTPSLPNGHVTTAAAGGAGAAIAAGYIPQLLSTAPVPAAPTSMPSMMSSPTSTRIRRSMSACHMVAPPANRPYHIQQSVKRNSDTG